MRGGKRAMDHECHLAIKTAHSPRPAGGAFDYYATTVQRAQTSLRMASPGVPGATLRGELGSV